MNVVRLDGNKIWTETADIDRLDLGLLSDAEIDGNVLLCNVGVFHLEPDRFSEESEVVTAWNTLYPNGKPKPEPVVTPKQADEIDMLMMENLDMQLKLNEQEKLINQLIINSLEVGV